MRMTSEQKVVAVGAASGVALMLAAVWGLTIVLPVPGIGDEFAPRLACALRANIFALIPFFIMLMMVSNERFFSEAIDPTQHAEGAATEINGASGFKDRVSRCQLLLLVPVYSFTYAVLRLCHGLPTLRAGRNEDLQVPDAPASRQQSPHASKRAQSAGHRRPLQNLRRLIQPDARGLAWQHACLIWEVAMPKGFDLRCGTGSKAFSLR
jgi:hypothetical protein